MNCRIVDDRDLLEQYVQRRLDDAERQAVELHVFECDRCLHKLQTLKALQRELSLQRDDILNEPTTRSAAWGWQLVAVAAVLVVAVGLGMTWKRPSPAARPTAFTSAVPSPAPSAARDISKTAPSPAVDLVALGRIEPPPYLPFTLRGDSQSAAFDRAMRDYVDGDYAAASRGLRRALVDTPDDVATNFFLGVSLMMIDDADGAAARLRKTMQLGDSPFEQLADLYLAKALIRRGDLPGARRELLKTAKLPGGHAKEASDLLQQLQSLENRTR
jgi:TolA-binding protein